MDYREKILAMAQQNPLLPNTVAKALATNTILAGAMLSEMCDKAMLKTSAVKVGGSPLYYIPGKEEQLLNFLSSLKEKDRQTVALLQEHKIIREQHVDPLTRVSLSIIKDFAKPLLVEYDGKQETFYKWFTIPDAEASELIKQQLTPPKAEVKPEPALKEEVKAEPKKVEKVEPKKIEAAPQTTLEPKKELPAGDFWQKLNTFFAQNSIVVDSHTVVKKKLEFDLFVTLPSPVGSLSYYCKARSKKKVTEADISTAYVQGQLHKLPTLYLIDGELTKKAKEISASLKGITIKTL